MGEDPHPVLKHKTILLVIPNLGIGGAQKVFLDQYAFYSKSFNTIGCVFNWDGVPVEDRQNFIISLNVAAGGNILEKALSFIRRVIILRRLKSENKVDISISHLEGADYINILSKGREKVVCWIHGSKRFDRNIKGLQGYLRKQWIIPLLYRRVDQIVTVSKAIRKEVAQLTGLPVTRIATLHNGFALDNIERSALVKITKFEELAEAHFLIIVHCRLSKEKNLQALLRIFSLLQPPAIGIKLVILGDGELRTDLEDICQVLGLSSYRAWSEMPWHHDYEVYFMGFQRNPFPYLRSAALYAMTSLNEGFPLSLCEAMACGVPVISSDCHTGPREILAPELETPVPVLKPFVSSYGILMPVPDSSERYTLWSDYILGLIADKLTLETLGKQGKTRIQDFNIRINEEKWLQFLS